MKKLLPFYVKVVRDGRESEVAAREIVPGDVVFISEGDKVPADIRLIEINGIRVNNASLTGESEAVVRTPEPFDGDIIISPNIAFAGTTVESGSAKGIVFSTGMRTGSVGSPNLQERSQPVSAPSRKRSLK